MAGIEAVEQLAYVELLSRRGSEHRDATVAELKALHEWETDARRPTMALKWQPARPDGTFAYEEEPVAGAAAADSPASGADGPTAESAGLREKQQSRPVRLLVVPSRRLGRPSRNARSSRKASALAQPWAASDACRLRVDPTAARRED
jgi:hypothetical protein